MSAKSDRLKVVLCWHMHQPDYRGPEESDYQLPWVYLHGIKDYVDMAAHLERNPKARAVVNFAPVLLEQIADYAEQIDAWLERGDRIRDPLLAALAGPGLPVDLASRESLVHACLRANEQRLIRRFEPFRELADLARWTREHPDTRSYLNDQYLTDLLVWYHLAWMGEHPRENDVCIRSLEGKGRGFDLTDRRRLVEVIGRLMSGLIGRYRTLAKQGRVELSVTPYAHPIMPLLLDIQSAREAMPDVRVPKITEYPQGEARVRWHIRRGIETFEKHFGFRPVGCWPSEGAISSLTLRILEEEGFQWAASGQQVLRNSLAAGSGNEPMSAHWVHRPYRLLEGDLTCYFRDDGLSDLMGFTYSEWHADDAVANLAQHLATIADGTQGQPDRVVSIIMDGENAWEYYPKNGWYFLKALYEKLSTHPKLELTTFSEIEAQRKTPPVSLKRIVAGSWVYGTLSTWIGDPDKNRAWEMLAEAKVAYDRVMAEGHLDDERKREIRYQLARCEGSDWFWWFGDYNPGETVSDFERLFRRQLTLLYKMLGVEAPEYLRAVFAKGAGDPAKGGVMRRNT